MAVKIKTEPHYGLKNEVKTTFLLYLSISNKPLEDIIRDFIQKGGRINSYYLNNPKRGPSLVFYKRWYRGRNIREAITRALAGL